MINDNIRSACIGGLILIVCSFPLSVIGLFWNSDTPDFTNIWFLLCAAIGSMGLVSIFVSGVIFLLSLCCDNNNDNNSDNPIPSAPPIPYHYPEYQHPPMYYQVNN